MDLKGKVVLITGSSSGIGQAVALRFAKEGAKVVVHYRVNKKGAEDTVKEIKKLGADAIIVQADITSDADITSMIDYVLQEYLTIDILINNAAMPNDPVPYIDSTSEDIKQVINTDLVAPMVVTQKVIKIMQEKGGGKIINTTSIRGWEHGGRSINYAASKAGLNSFTRTLAKLVAPDIQVNAVAPGFVRTRNYDGMDDALIKTFIDQTYLKRWVSLEEVAEAYVFLAKNDAMTGQVIYVDAGFTLK